VNRSMQILLGLSGVRQHRSIRRPQGATVPTSMYSEPLDAKERLIESARELLWQRGYVAMSPRKTPLSRLIARFAEFSFC
jgi:hypothetical protein